MNIPSHTDLARSLLPEVARAARLELGYFRGTFDVRHKSDASPVTIADQEAEAILVGALASIAPDIPVIAEEQFSAGIVPEIEGTFFLVDALDGTREFIRGKVDFTVNVALIVDRRPVFGVIMLPASGEIYITTSARNVGYAVIDVKTEIDFENLELAPIATREPDPEALVVSLSRSHPSQKLEEELAGKPIAGRVEAGSSLKFCRVAEGKADFYPRLGSISEWDIAAGHAIVKAAGGEVTRLDGGPLLYGNAAARFRTEPFVAWGRESLKHRLRFTRG